ncbi:CGP-CTERM sorting domain-containing protein [Thermococcus chitonophagus]|uniref:CGP-CTERM sorting domain-containing protein n=1 Tax=Thermococcus chitonophagus TaxID=54262 RepID=A0A160VU65_9EURY|nr:ABC transporter substrate-binding protein [Thermococcus chitonophagus]ASJ15947.1 CGP-CTERM sorting domain-containing protein [Thermococcus chitonophagus]CUX77191.1 lipoprotein, putative [Thermococcus chitonophagus]
MKRLLGLLTILVALGMVATPLLVPVAAAEQGKPVDTIYLTIRTNAESAISDVAKGGANGGLDVFLYPVSGREFKNLPKDIIDKLRLIKSVGGEVAIQINPVHDDDNPYLITVGDKQYFNPFAIKEVRFALNYLINRQYIVTNIYGGSAQPMYGCVRPSVGAATHFDPVYKAFGFSPVGDVAKAQQIFNEAMKKAAEDLAKQGHKLELKKGPDGKEWWYFDGEPVTVKFIIRVEDERKDIGMYVSDLLEKYFHLKVQKLLWNAQKAIPAVYYKDPKNFEWQLYTAGWIITSNVKWPDWQTAAFYSTIWGKQPAAVGWSYKPETTVKDLVDYFGGPEKFIQLLDLKYYNTPEKLKQLYDMNIDPIVEMINYGETKFNNKTYVLEEGNVDQYWDLQKISMAQGIMDGLVVFIAEQWEYFPVNKERVTRIAADVSSGLYSWWMWRGLETVDGVAYVAEFSQGGSIYTNAMNPIGGGGDIYGNMIMRAISDPAVYVDPATGTIIPGRCTFKVERGPFKVPKDAVIYNSTLKKWVPQHAGELAKVRVTYTCKFGKWQDGTPMTMADIKAAIAFDYEWSYKDGPNDPYYDEAMGASTRTLEQTLGFVFVNDTTYIVYSNITHPVADDQIAGANVWWTTIPWYLRHAMEELVANPQKYGVTHNYTFSQAEGARWLDLLVKDHVDDLKKVIEKLIQEDEAPWYIKDDIKGDPAQYYKALLNFINKYGHAYDSNGPFYIEKYDPDKMLIVLKRFNGNPIPPDYWKKHLLIARMVPKTVFVPPRVNAGNPLEIRVTVNLQEEFPDWGEKPADKGYVNVMILDESGNTVYQGKAELKSPGNFVLSIPADETKNWKPGKYTALIQGGLYAGSISFTTKKPFIVLKPQTTSSPAQTTTSSPAQTTSSPAQTTTSSPAQTTPSPTQTTTTKGGICGPAALVGLAVLPLLLRRRRK